MGWRWPTLPGPPVPRHEPGPKMPNSVIPHAAGSGTAPGLKLSKPGKFPSLVAFAASALTCREIALQGDFRGCSPISDMYPIAA